MKFMHPQGARLALLSGHVATLPPGEWVELNERFHESAMLARCACDQAVIPVMVDIATAASPQAVVPFSESDAIRKVLIAMIERQTEGDFTIADLPNLNVVRRDVGFPVEKSQVFAIYNELKREAGLPSEPTAAVAEAIESVA